MMSRWEQIAAIALILLLALYRLLGAGIQPPVSLKGAPRKSALPGVSKPGGIAHFAEDFISPAKSNFVVHASTLTATASGTLAAAWYGGTREGAGDVAVYMTLQKPGSTWSEPGPILTRESAMQGLRRYVKKLGNAVLFSLKAGDLNMIFTTVAVGGWSGSSLNIMSSTDLGRTWRAPQRLALSPFFNVSELVRAKPLIQDDVVLVPIYHECLRKFPEFLFLQPEGPADRWRYQKTSLTSGRDYLQPSIVDLGDGGLVALLRDASFHASMGLSRSLDHGRHWDAPQSTGLPNPDSGLDTVLLPDQTIVVVFNDSSSGRDNLRLATSSNQGRTWMRRKFLAQEPGSELSYPAMIRTPDGLVHVTYTWKRQRIRHAVFNEAWLLQEGSVP